MNAGRPEAGAGRGAHLLVNAFLVLNLVAVAAWLAPRGWLLRERIVDVVRPYVRLVGLDQRWQMFSPDPARANVDVTATLRYADGRERTWVLAPMDGRGHLERARLSRHRRWVWSLAAREEPRAWDDAARWALATFDTDPARRAVKLTLKTRSAPIPPPGAPAVRGATETVVAAFDVRREAAR